MKIAFSGKGGVGKTTIASGLALLFSKEGKKVIAIDADPDANLGATLGFSEPDKIKAIIDMKELIHERTGARPGTTGGFFKLNPRVEDIPEKFFVERGGIKLLRMGGGKKGGSGCFCPENTFLKALLNHLLIARDDIVIIDMEAGIEHLGRGTASGVDILLIVVEPTSRSIETAFRINKLAGEIGIKKILVIGNKVTGRRDIDFIKGKFTGIEIIGFICYNKAFLDKVDESVLKELKDIKDKLEG
ncbi:MAG: AAA family ATPase [Candidatus Omnitrophica bacterium]|nr:AAA family ATPase [Candidatus Omnitrophota bacterium]